ncbi:MAG: hypothetical protein M0D55_15035 [Elusimicrobiota bacterium]|nr:MAG: hypothetical protein M0D55_15035 [Elusimicrobiota bacterium]
MTPSNDRKDAQAPAVIPCAMELLSERLFPDGIVAGQQLLLSGEPGVSKSTLLLQALNGFAEAGVPCAYITSEQKRPELQRRLQAVGTEKGIPLVKIHEADSLETLSNLISRPSVSFPHRVLVVDSLQGLGIGPSAQGEWEKLFGLMQFLRIQNIATFYVAHVRKDLQIAGPKKLEHEVDAVFSIRRAFAYRLLHVSKNRFGPSSAEPVVCTVDRIGRLFLAQRNEDVVVAKTAAFDSHGIAEIEAKVEFNINCRSRRPALNGLAKHGYQKITSILRGMSVDVGGFGSLVTCSLPGSRKYLPEHDLAIAMAFLSSYLQLPLRDDPILCGELGLDGELRSLHPSLLQRLAALIDQDFFYMRSRTIVMDAASALVFKGMLDKIGKGRDLVLVKANSLSGVAHHYLLHDPAPEPTCLEQEQV